MLVYFNTDWDEQAGQLRLLRSRTDIEDYAAEVPPAGGTLLVFRRAILPDPSQQRAMAEGRGLSPRPRELGPADPRD